MSGDSGCQKRECPVSIDRRMEYCDTHEDAVFVFFSAKA